MKIIWTLVLSILNPFLVIAGIFMAGGGHGDVSLLMFCYPGLWVFKIAQDSALMWGWLFCQFSIYGLIIDLSRMKSVDKFAVIVIVVVHLVLFSIATNNSA
jgi:hypothetical protein